jgi:hypothetical protein
VNPAAVLGTLPSVAFGLNTDSYMTWLEHGAVSVAWWVLHLGIRTHNNSSPLYGLKE